MGSDINNIFTYVAFISAVAGVLGFLASLASKAFSFWRSKTPETADPHANLEKLVRLDEIKKAMNRNKNAAWWADVSNTLLTFIQFVVGGALSTSFLQNSLDKQIISFLGLIILISSLIHKFFRPDLKYRGATRRFVKLNNLLKQTENGIVAIREKWVNAKPVELFVEDVTEQLFQIQKSESEELTGEMAIPTTTKSDNLKE